jgi:aminoglycoside phosphotransferase (APT) family kinase protein
MFEGMGRPWDGEFLLSDELCVSLIETQFSRLAPVRLQTRMRGWDNECLLMAPGNLVFRFPRRQVAVPLLETELRVLPLLAPRLPIAIPNVRYVGQPSDAHPRPFGGFDFIEGTPASELGPSFDGARLSIPLARFLRALHAIAPMHLGLPMDSFAKGDAATQRKTIAQRLVSLEGQLPAQLCERINFYSAFPKTQPHQESVPVHGDLYRRHLVLDSSGDLEGVIDWGDLHLGNPATDLSIVYSAVPPHGRTEFWRHYGPVAGPLRELARLRAISHSLSLLWYALDTKELPLRNSSLDSLNISVS